jgi:deazaflavin-dependent oxidoreductase (nitroreductase family)
MTDEQSTGTAHDSLMPSWMPRVNKLVVNPVQRLWAPYLPPFAMVHHRGRRSGKAYDTPVLAFRSGSTIAIPLAYGSETQWLRNLRAAGGGELRRAGRRQRIGNLRIVTDPRAPDLPPVARAAVGRMPFLLADLGAGVASTRPSA